MSFHVNKLNCILIYPWLSHHTHTVLEPHLNSYWRHYNLVLFFVLEHFFYQAVFVKPFEFFQAFHSVIILIRSCVRAILPLVRSSLMLERIAIIIKLFDQHWQNWFVIVEILFQAPYSFFLFFFTYLDQTMNIRESVFHYSCTMAQQFCILHTKYNVDKICAAWS